LSNIHHPLNVCWTVHFAHTLTLLA
jgi:hypothetical protein